MDCFSWKTADTNESIPNKYSVKRPFTVYLLCPDGMKIREDCYDGYGKFGGEDVYELFVRWNCPEQCTGNLDTDRMMGIDFEQFYPEKMKYPIKIVRDPDLNYDDVNPSPMCVLQGFCYPEGLTQEDMQKNSI